jgi:hypothetical protein
MGVTADVGTPPFRQPVLVPPNPRRRTRSPPVRASRPLPSRPRRATEPTHRSSNPNTVPALRIFLRLLLHGTPTVTYRPLRRKLEVIIISARTRTTTRKEKKTTTRMTKRCCCSAYSRECRRKRARRQASRRRLRRPGTGAAART